MNAHQDLASNTCFWLHCGVQNRCSCFCHTKQIIYDNRCEINSVKHNFLMWTCLHAVHSQVLHFTCKWQILHQKVYVSPR